MVGRSASRKAEIDFLVSVQGQILPLAAKAGENPRSKSLGVYRERYHPQRALRTTLLNLKRQDALINIPLHAIGLMPRLVHLTGVLQPMAGNRMLIEPLRPRQPGFRQ